MQKYLNYSKVFYGQSGACHYENNIFNKNINKNYKLIPFNITKNSVGETKYFPSAFKE